MFVKCDNCGNVKQIKANLAEVVTGMINIEGPVWDGLSLKQISLFGNKLVEAGFHRPFTDEMIKSIEITQIRPIPQA